VEWSPTAIASPSGLAVRGRSAYVASLRGEVLYRVRLDGVTAREPVRVRLGDLGRLRTVETAPDGSLWLVTNNTDGRGTPRPGDDRILRLRVG
jgi:glucose/arabinose dehydrogenase